MINFESNSAFKANEQNSPNLDQSQLAANRMLLDTMPQSGGLRTDAHPRPHSEPTYEFLGSFDAGQYVHHEQPMPEQLTSHSPDKSAHHSPDQPDVPPLEQKIGRQSGTPNDGGHTFLERLGANPANLRQNGVTGSAREQAILEEVNRGNVPEFLSHLKHVTMHDKKGNTIELNVMPDYFAVGNNRDFVRMPMTPAVAKTLGDRLDLALPTEKVADAIYRNADIKLHATGMVNNRSDCSYMSGNGFYLKHDQLIQQQLGDANGQGQLVAGHKKDLILSKFALNHPDKLDFYGFFDGKGKAIQGSGGGPHEATYVDYSHGVRFISQNVIVNGKPMRYDDVLKNPELCGLLTNEGPYDAAAIYGRSARNKSGQTL